MPDTPHTRTIEIRQTRETVAALGEETILDAALRHGVLYPHGCRSGRCGACKSRLIEGAVELLPHTRFALSPEEIAQGLTLACRARPRTDTVVAWLGALDEAPTHPVVRLSARVARVEDLTRDIRLVRLEFADGRAPAFSAGQYGMLSFPGCPARAYSMANAPGEPALEFHVRRVAGGAATGRIFTALEVGDDCVFEGPFGAAHLRERHPGPLLCVGGGSGLAPIKAIVETALHLGLCQPIHLYAGARSEADLYLVEHFRALERRYSNLRFTAVVADGAAGSIWPRGRVSEVVEQDFADLSGFKVYAAGSPATVAAVAAAVAAKGVAAEDLHLDAFYTPQPARAAEA